MKQACPACYSMTGHSIIMEEDKGVYCCTKNASHRFKKNKDGFFEPHKM